MTRRTTLWLTAATLFTAGNLAAAVYAAVLGEPLHAGAHVALALLGLYWAWRLTSRAGDAESLRSPLRAPLTDPRLEELQQSVDAVALEVERIGEAQRFSDKLQAERLDTRR